MEPHLEHVINELLVMQLALPSTDYIMTVGGESIGGLETSRDRYDTASKPWMVNVCGTYGASVIHFLCDLPRPLIYGNYLIHVHVLIAARREAACVLDGPHSQARTVAEVTTT